MFAFLLALSLAAAPPPSVTSPDALRKELDGIAEQFHGVLGYSLHHLRTGDRLERRGDEKFPTASTIKLAMLCTAMEKQQKGEIDYYQTRRLNKEDASEGTGFMRHYREGTRVKLKEMLHLMITASDNTATDMLGQWLGTEPINGWLDRRGFKVTRLLIPWPIQGSFKEDFAARSKLWEPFKQWGMGVTTPHEMGELMEMIVDGRAGTAAACDEMHRILNHQYFDDGIAGQIPPWVAVASKSGIEARSRSDVAMVHSPSGDYCLAIYTREARDTSVKRENEQDSAIRAISRAVWRHYHPQIRWTPPAGVEKFSAGPDW